MVRALIFVGVAVGVGCAPCSDDLVDIEHEDDLEAVASCENISGHLRIVDQDWLFGIELPYLKTIGGLLAVDDLPALIELEMPNLESIGGNFAVGRNASLASLEGLSSLESIGGGLFVIGNDAMTSLHGLSSLSSVGNQLVIFDNGSLCTDAASAFEKSVEVEGRVLVYLNGSARTDCE